MAAKKGSWTRFASTLSHDDSGGRVLTQGGFVDVAASADGRYVALASKLLATEPKQAVEELATRIYELDASSRARLVYEVNDAGGNLALANDGSVVFVNAKGAVLARPDGTRRVYSAHSVPRFDAAGALVANTWIDGTNYLVRYDLCSGELLRKDPYSAGNIPLSLLANGDLVGHGGWLSPDGTRAPRREGDWQWERAMPSGNELIIRPLPIDATASASIPDDMVRLDRAGNAVPIGDAVCGASPDGRFLIVYRYPTLEDAHARGLSQHNARSIELVDVASGARKTLTAIGFPEAKILAWTASGMVLAVHGTVVRYDPTQDALHTSRPLETRALIAAGSARISAHEDGVRLREGDKDLFAPLGAPLGPQGLRASPNHKRFVVACGSQMSALDASLTARELGRATRVVFAGDDHCVVTRDGANHLVSLANDEERPLDLTGVKSIASLSDGFVAFFDKRIELRNANGSVRETWPVKKAPKPFALDGVTAVYPAPEGFYAVSRRRLFHCSEKGITHLLTTTEKVLGSLSSAYEGMLHAVAFSTGKLAIAVFSNSWHGVLVCTLEDEILGWTGTYADAPAGLAWSGDTLIVSERNGRTHRIQL